MPETKSTRRWGLLAAVAAAAAAIALGAVLLARGSGDDAASVTDTAAASDAAAVTALSSYRYTLTLELAGGFGAPAATAGGAPLTFSIAGEVVAPGREHSTVKANLGLVQLDLETIQVGNRAWTREDRGAWELQEGAAGGPFGLAIDPVSLLSPGDGGLDRAAVTRLRDGLRELRASTDTVNGVEALRYTLNADELRRLFAAGAEPLPAGTELRGDATLWVTRRDALPLRLQLAARGVREPGELRLELTLSDLNSPSIRIEPPV
jgi:hypothetical protein